MAGGVGSGVGVACVGVAGVGAVDVRGGGVGVDGGGYLGDSAEAFSAAVKAGVEGTYIATLPAGRIAGLREGTTFIDSGLVLYVIAANGGLAAPKGVPFLNKKPNNGQAEGKAANKNSSPASGGSAQKGSRQRQRQSQGRQLQRCEGQRERKRQEQSGSGGQGQEQRQTERWQKRFSRLQTWQRR